MAEDYGIEDIDLLKPIPEQIFIPTTITSEESGSTALTTFQVTITFREAVTGFTVGGITVGNATLSNFSGSGRVYTVDVSPVAPGLVLVDVNAGVAKSRVGYDNQQSNNFNITFTT